MTKIIVNIESQRIVKDITPVAFAFPMYRAADERLKCLLRITAAADAHNPNEWVLTFTIVECEPVVIFHWKQAVRNGYMIPDGYHRQSIRNAMAEYALEITPLQFDTALQGVLEVLQPIKKTMTGVVTSTQKASHLRLEDPPTIERDGFAFKGLR